MQPNAPTDVLTIATINRLLCYYCKVEAFMIATLNFIDVSHNLYKTYTLNALQVSRSRLMAIHKLLNHCLAAVYKLMTTFLPPSLGIDRYILLGAGKEWERGVTCCTICTTQIWQTISYMPNVFVSACANVCKYIARIYINVRFIMRQVRLFGAAAAAA